MWRWNGLHSTIPVWQGHAPNRVVGKSELLEYVNNQMSKRRWGLGMVALWAEGVRSRQRCCLESGTTLRCPSQGSSLLYKRGLSKSIAATSAWAGVSERFLKLVVVSFFSLIPGVKVSAIPEWVAVECQDNLLVHRLKKKCFFFDRLVWIVLRHIFPNAPLVT